MPLRPSSFPAGCGKMRWAGRLACLTSASADLPKRLYAVLSWASTWRAVQVFTMPQWLPGTRRSTSLARGFALPGKTEATSTAFGAAPCSPFTVWVDESWVLVDGCSSPTPKQPNTSTARSPKSTTRVGSSMVFTRPNKASRVRTAVTLSRAIRTLSACLKQGFRMSFPPRARPLRWSKSD